MRYLHSLRGTMCLRWQINYKIIAEKNNNNIFLVWQGEVRSRLSAFEDWTLNEIKIMESLLAFFFMFLTGAFSATHVACH